MKLAIAVAGLLAVTVPGQAAGWPAADSFMNAAFVCDNAPDKRACQFGMETFPADYAKAIQGDYLAQQNVAYCFETGCDWAVKPDQTLACAWHIVIMGSGHLQLKGTDRKFAEAACKKLDRIGRKTAERQAENMLRLLGVE